MSINKIGERGRAKFIIKPGNYSGYYLFEIQSPYLSLSSSVEGYIWPEGENPNKENSPYIHQFQKDYNKQNAFMYNDLYIASNKRYFFHIYYYYKGQKTYLDEIVFKI